MIVEKMELAELVQAERNVRVHTEKQLAEFVRSLKQFGQTRPAVIDENNKVLIGNGMIEAMKRIGMDTVEVFRKAGLSENEKKKLMMADNKIYSLGLDDYDTIERFLAELGGDLDVPGFDEEILKSMVFSAEEVAQKLNDYGTLEPEVIQTIRENGERKEAAMQKTESAEGTATEADEEARTYREDSYTTEGMSQAETQKFIICPNCGEKICL